MASTRLPKRDEAIVQQALTNPVWTVKEDTAPSDNIPAPRKCEAQGHPEQVCCRTLKGDDERKLVDPAVVK